LIGSNVRKPARNTTHALHKKLEKKRQVHLRLKIVLLSIVPMSIALGAVIVTVRHQTLELAKQERKLVESAYLASKEAELRAYVRLAQSAIAPLVNDISNPNRQLEAIASLARLEFGTDGYFFVYDMNGKNLMHPRQPGLVGRDLLNMDDGYGGRPIQKLLEATRNGGGIVRYYWEKPSSKQVASKLGYVEPVLPWGWMLGTGLYLDDIEQALQRIDASAQANMRDTQIRMYVIAIIAIILIGSAGLALNLSDNKEASAKLRQLAQRVVHSQEEERARVARELHDGIIQVLVSSKFLLETAQLQLDHRVGAVLPSQPGVANTFTRGLERLNEALTEVRRISHGLRPALLDDFGLAPALDVMTREVQEQGDFTVQFTTIGQPWSIPLNHSTALFRITQESLTNARLHSGAALVLVELKYHRHRVSLTVTDDGKGFDVRRAHADSRSGIGLRNMRERMEGLGGTLTISSSHRGTRVHASLRTFDPPQTPTRTQDATDDSPYIG
jgi:two-component system NarL family sensor kinase